MSLFTFKGKLNLMKMKASYLQTDGQRLIVSYYHKFFVEEYFKATIQTECRAMIWTKKKPISLS